MRYLPRHPDQLEHVPWSSVDGVTQSWTWSNEPETGSVDLPAAAGRGEAPDAHVLWTGYSDADLVGQAADVLAPGESPSVGGIWSLGRVTGTGAAVTSSFAGIESWYLAEGDDGSVWLGSRPGLVHGAATGAAQPRLDHVALAGVANAGYCVTDRSPFDGVRVVPRDVVETLTWDARAGRVAREQHRRTPRRSAVGGQALADALTLAAAEVGTLSEDGQRVGVTGGRDSRLVVAALVAAGVPVRTFTKGAPGEPDAVVGAMVAEALGVPHERVDRPGQTGARSAKVDPAARLHQAVVIGDGGVSGFDATGGSRLDYATQRAGLSGSGGETVRGAYARIQFVSANPAAGERWMERTLLGGLDHLEPEVRAGYLADVEPWLDQVRREPLQGLYDFFLDQRQSRWFGAARFGTSLIATPRTIFLDDRVMAACEGVPVEELCDERLIRDMLAIIAPQLLDVPFVGERLTCEQDDPRRPEPVPAVKGAGGAFSWRTSFDRPLAEALHREAARGTAMLDGDVLDRMDLDGSATAADARRRWHLATVGAMHDPAHFDPDRRFDPEPAPVLVSAREQAPEPSAADRSPATRALDRVRQHRLLRTPTARRVLRTRPARVAVRAARRVLRR